MGDFFGIRVEKVAESNVLVTGIPWDESSSFRKGSVNGPDGIRTATASKLYNSFTEMGLNLKDVCKVFDSGNIDVY